MKKLLLAMISFGFALAAFGQGVPVLYYPASPQNCTPGVGVLLPDGSLNQCNAGGHGITYKGSGLPTAPANGDYLRTAGPKGGPFVWTPTALLSGDIISSLGYTPLQPANNLSDLSSASTALTNLGAQPAGSYQAALGFTPLNKASNLSDVASAGTALSNLGAQPTLGFTPLNPANNLSDVASTSTALRNLGGVLWNGSFTAFADVACIEASGSIYDCGHPAMNPANNLSEVTNQATARSNLGAVGVNGSVTTGHLATWGSSLQLQDGGSPPSVYLTATSSSVGGSALGANACTSSAVTMIGASTGIPCTVAANDGTNAAPNVVLFAEGTGSNAVTLYVCVIAAATPAAKIYKVRCFP